LWITFPKQNPPRGILFSSALGWNRTNDPLLKRQVLYRLSYERLCFLKRTVLYTVIMEISREEKNYLLVLHDIRSVFNVGALFRTADAVGISHIILSGFSPTPIDRFGRARADFAKCSLGSEKTVSWEYVKTPNVKIKKLKTQGFHVVGVEQDKNSIDYKKVMKTEKMIFILGTETTGVSKPLLKLCDTIAEIPMNGMKESLNVSVAGGIVLYRILDK
jgi:23S rRNA (guanosine2251-2'-O)-methyltransferase